MFWFEATEAELEWYETRLPVKVGLSTLDKPMTKMQAFKYGEKHMPKDLKRAGFQTVIFTSDPVIHGGLWYRINYGK
jgi:hypothetical protein